MPSSHDVTIMKGLGHFPMSENAQLFLNYLLPALEKISAIPGAESFAAKPFLGRRAKATRI